MQINFKSFFSSLLGERLLHRLKTRVLLLWNASWRDTRLCLLSLGWQLGGRLWALWGPDLEEFCGAASTRQDTAILLEKKKKIWAWFMTVEWEGPEEGRGLYLSMIQETPEPPAHGGECWVCVLAVRLGGWSSALLSWGFNKGNWDEGITQGQGRV